MPNQLIVSKTFAVSHACNFPLQKFNSVDNLSIRLHMQKI